MLTDRMRRKKSPSVSIQNRPHPVDRSVHTRSSKRGMRTEDRQCLRSPTMPLESILLHTDRRQLQLPLMHIGLQIEQHHRSSEECVQRMAQMTRGDLTHDPRTTGRTRRLICDRHNAATIRHSYACSSRRSGVGFISGTGHPIVKDERSVTRAPCQDRVTDAHRVFRIG